MLWPVYLAPAHDWVVNVVRVGYPTVDALVAALVLALGMRQPAGRRRPWVFAGGAFLVLAVTDSTYVHALSQGQTGLTGDPMVVGWMSAWLLLALAPWVAWSDLNPGFQRDCTVAIEVYLVANGEEVLHAISAVGYSAVLMDCRTPVMDGFTETVEIRRSQGSQSRVPIIALTAGAMIEDRQKCLAVGMDEYVSKPVKTGVLAKVLARWIPAISRISS